MALAGMGGNMGEQTIRVNFHVHSTLSDGELPPEILARRLAESGVAYAALTDHDTVRGCAAFREALQRLGVGCIDGLELTAATSLGTAHLLAYGMDMADAGLLALLPLAPTRDPAGEGRSGPRSNGIPPVGQAIAAIHQAGGAAFLAHPLTLGQEEEPLDRLLAELAPLGLDGIEAFYGAYGEVETARLLALADRHGLAVSAGGDFHHFGAPGQAEVMLMPARRWVAFRDSLLRRSRGTPLASASLEAPDALATPEAPGTSPVSSPPADRPTDRPLPLPGRNIARILVPAVTAVVLFIVSLFGLIIPRVEAMMLGQKKEAIKELTDSAISILVEYERQAVAGVMPAERARTEAVARLRDLRYGSENKDYFWITDMLPRMVMHPYRTDLEGKDLTGFRDEAGLAIFVEFVNAVRDKDDGYVEYLWQWKDDQSRIVPKLSFVKRFAPWNWVIGTGIYLEDVLAEIAALSSRLVLLSLVISAVLTLLVVQMARQTMKVEQAKLAAELTLRESRERYRALADAATDGTVIVSGGACTFANETFLRMTGYAEKEVQLLRATELLEPRDQAERFTDLVASRPSEGPDQPSLSIECWLTKRSGERVEVAVSGTRINIGIRPGAVLSVKELRFSPDDESGADREERRYQRLAARLVAETAWLARPALPLAVELPRCLSGDPVRLAAARMEGRRSGALLVTDSAGRSLGLVTADDIAGRLVAVGGDPESAVGAIMTAPLLCLDAGVSAAAALVAMRGRGVDRALLANPGCPPQRLVRAADLALAQADAFPALHAAAATAQSTAALAELASRAADRLGQLAELGLRPRIVLRLHAEIQDAIIQGLARLISQDLGEAPAEWAFLALGSLGRQEYLPGSDQDNALVWRPAGGDPAAERSWFVALATRLCAGLEAVGQPRCPGGVMALNPLWNGPFAEWQARLEHGIGEPEPARLLDLSILLDFRCAAGSSRLTDELRAVVQAAIGRNPAFLTHLAAAERQKKLPSNQPRSAHGACLKDLGAILGGCVRLYALQAGCRATGTFERLDELMESGRLKPETGSSVLEAFEAVLAMRLERSLGRPDQRPLSAREEALLAFALEQAGLIHKLIGYDFLGQAL